MSKSALTPTEELVLEVLAARWRTGETTWTFRSRNRRAINALSDKSLVWAKGGVLENTLLVGLTEEGRALCIFDAYTPPRHASRRMV